MPRIFYVKQKLLCLIIFLFILNSIGVYSSSSMSINTLSSWTMEDVFISKKLFLNNNSYEYIIDSPSYSLSFSPNHIPRNDGYPTFDEVEKELFNISTSYPNITLLASIGSSWEGRCIWCLEVSDSPGVDEGEPGVLFMGLHHAREWPTVEICLYIAEKLVSEYGLNSTVTSLVNNRRIWIIPCVNPDGYVFSHDLGHDWRKNRHYFPEYDTYGVDLNRNYAGSCNGDLSGWWGSGGVTSHKPSDETFCGLYPFSEPETRAIRDFIMSNDICASISYHTYGELVIWPWGYSPYLSTPDEEFLREIGEGIASRITRQSGSGTYKPMQSSELYPTTGDSDDWLYGYSHYVLGKPLYPYTIEACSTFHPSGRAMEQVRMENFKGAIYLLEKAEEIKKVKPRVLPPLFMGTSFESPTDFTLHWVERNPLAEAERFELEELKGLDTINDSAENPQLWLMNGFSRSSSRFHSPSYSYCFSQTSGVYGYMSSIYPIPIDGDLKLSFWCLYDLSNNSNYGFVEVSRDGRIYSILDSFTGSSHGWVYREYPLDSYFGSSIYIRFRVLRSVSGMGGNEFFVDDISPTPFFRNTTILSSTIHGYSYSVEGKDDGVYYYRVRGFNSEHGWGDFSCLEKVVVASSNNPPSPPVIRGRLLGWVEKGLTYDFKVHDVDGDNLSLYVNWGDGTVSGWINNLPSGETISLTHSWMKPGFYIIEAVTRDVYGLSSSEKSFVIILGLK